MMRSRRQVVRDLEPNAVSRHGQVGTVGASRPLRSVRVEAMKDGYASAGANPAVRAGPPYRDRRVRRYVNTRAWHGVG